MILQNDICTVNISIDTTYIVESTDNGCFLSRGQKDGVKRIRIIASWCHFGQKRTLYQ